jgi:hypothetical protein
VVEVRSYSLISGSTSHETLNGRRGALRAMICLIASSCAGLTNELIRHTAIASTPSTSSASTARSASLGSSGRSTVPA